MNWNRVLASLACIGAMLLAQPSPAAAVEADSYAEQWAPKKWVLESIQNIAVKAKVIADNDQYGLDDQRISLVGGLMEPGRSMTFTWHFERGERVLFVGGGDSDVRDLDLSLRRKGETATLASDTMRDATPIVRYTIPAAGAYTIEMKLYSADRSSFCSVALMTRSAKNFKIEDLGAATGAFTALGERLNDTTSGVHFAKNQWTLFGTFLGGTSPTSQSVGEFNLTDPATHVFAASNDVEHHDINLRLTQGSAKLASDTLKDGLPWVRVKRNNRVNVKVEHAGSTGRAFVFFGIAREPEAR